MGAAEAVVGGKRKRFATIRATEEQYKQELNVFASGVKWEKIESAPLQKQKILEIISRNNVS